MRPIAACKKNNLKGKKEERGEAIYRACRAFFTAEFMIPARRRSDRVTSVFLETRIEWKRIISIFFSSIIVNIIIAINSKLASKDWFNGGYQQNCGIKWNKQFDNFYKKIFLNLMEDARRNRIA